MFEGISYHLQYLVRSVLAVGVWQERETRGGTGRAVFVFFARCICSLSSSEGLTQGNNIVKIVLRSPLRHAEHFAFFSSSSFVSGRHEA